MASRERLQRLVVTITVVAALVIGLVVLRNVLDTPDCTVVRGDRTVELSTDDAEAASRGKDIDLSEEDARIVNAVFRGRLQHALICRHGGADRTEADQLNSRGLTHRADAVRLALGADFDGLRFGGYQPGGVKAGHMVGSAHYEGRAIDLFFRPVNKPNRQRGWALAHYLVANAERLKIETVIYDVKIWTHRRAEQGWRDYRVDTSDKPASVRKVLLHKDHVHVDVAD